jgi:CheY-like chemotaxis protein
MRTLLLADDSITVQRVIALTFAEQPVRVIAVSDGNQAMERMAAQKPDIVLAGTTLPHLSGYEVARLMRTKPELKDVPILLLAGAFETVDEEKLAASGANGVIEKPVEPTIVINRVKELLGLKPESKPAAPAGRLITSPQGPKDRKPPQAPAEKTLPVARPPRAVTSTIGTPSKWEQLRDQTGLDADTRSVEDSSTRPDGYLDTLDAAFDTLDQQLSGRVPAQSRNPAGPLGQSSAPTDPRSPGRRPLSNGVPGNPVFEVDDEWFGGAESQAAADARTGQRELHEDLRSPDLSAPAAAPNAIFEVDDEWFAEDDKARAVKALEQRQLAAEMGIHDVELPPAEPGLTGAAPAADLDFDFGIDELRRPESGATAEFSTELREDLADVSAEASPKVEAEDLAMQVADMTSAIEPPVAEAVPAPVVFEEPVPEPEAPPESASEPEATIAPAAFDALDALLSPAPPPFTPPAPAEPATPFASLTPAAAFAPMPEPEASETLEAPALEAPQAPEAPEASAYARSDTSELRRDLAEAASGREGGPEAPNFPLSAIVPLPPAVAVADDFAALLAFEQGDHSALPVQQPAPVVEVVAPTITDEMLDQIAARVADRLNNAVFGDELRNAMTAAVRETVRTVVSETSERIVRDEIDRIKSKRQED